MVQKMTLPGGPSANALSLETGVPQVTLSRWLRLYGIKSTMENKKTPKSWSIKDKFEAIMKTFSMSEHELGEYLRKHGLHSKNIEEWRKEFESGAQELFSLRKKEAKEIKSLNKKVKNLEKDLKRKDKALAEASALIILKKKANLLWGIEEEDE